MVALSSFYNKKYDRSVLELAYGLLVKGYTRNTPALLVGGSASDNELLEAGCTLARIDLSCSGSPTTNAVALIKESGAKLLFVPTESMAAEIMEELADTAINTHVYTLEGEGRNSISYLKMLGATWKVKYKPAIDRRLRELFSYSSSL